MIRQFRGCGAYQELLKLLDCKDLVGFDIGEFLPDAARPRQFDLVYYGRLAQTEMDALVAGRVVAYGRCGVIVLHQLAGGDLDAGPEAVPVAFCADQVDQEPVITVGGAVEEQFGPAIQNHYHHVDLPVIVEVPECRAAVSGWDCERGASPRGHVGESEIAVVPE